MLDVPAEFHHLKPGQLHAALRVELAGGRARLAAQKTKPSAGRNKKHP
jgi:hypothetical protein